MCAFGLISAILDSAVSISQPIICARISSQRLLRSDKFHSAAIAGARSAAVSALSIVISGG
eukprot:COSAG06_NODE_19073_length_854_cov_3.711258_2_plen_60_part_01